MKYSLILCSDMHMDIERANNFVNNTNLEWTTDYTLADYIIIMTCAFGIKKNYSMYVIADVLRNSKPESLVIATGCLAKINERELKAIPNLEVKSLDEVAAFLGKTSGSMLKRKIPQNNVIISSGCLKKCSYCIYSLLEPIYYSKPLKNILEEIQEISKYESIVYITGAHETSDYGVDIYGKRKFAELVDTICTKFPNCRFVIGWFHPAGLTDDVINVIAKYKNIVQIMIHIQHNDNEILKNMHRPSFEWTESKIQKLHSIRPDLSISTELIVGYPGETEEKFSSLVEYLKKNRDVYQDIGVASYEPVLNTKAAQMPNLPDYDIRNKRMEIIKKKFGATNYPAPKDFTPILSIYLEARFLLSQIPQMCKKTIARQKYPYVAGTDTEFKMNFLVKLEKSSKEELQELMESDEYYTPEFKKWLMQYVKSQM